MFNHINSLHNNKSRGDDGICAFYMQIAAIVISPVLAHLTSLLFTLGTSPTCLKKADVIPIHKSGNEDEKTLSIYFSPFQYLPRLLKNLYIKIRLLKFLTIIIYFLIVSLAFAKNAQLA